MTNFQFDDKQLIRLIKDVSEEYTEWNSTSCVIRQYSLTDEPIVIGRTPEGFDTGVLSGKLIWELPFFTSDYLIEKLPHVIKSKEHPGLDSYLTMRAEETEVYAWYATIQEDPSDIGVHSDTLLKALLKIAIKVKGWKNE